MSEAYAFLPLLDANGEMVVRPPVTGEWFLDTDCETVQFVVANNDLHYAYPIYLRVPYSPDTAAEVAFARMVIARSAAPHSDWVAEYNDLAAKVVHDGDRSPSLVAEMEALTAKMTSAALAERTT